MKCEYGKIILSRTNHPLYQICKLEDSKAYWYSAVDRNWVRCDTEYMFKSMNFIQIKQHYRNIPNEVLKEIFYNELLEEL